MPKKLRSNFPLVSVITPNFNGYKFIKRAIESVKLQNFNCEHIVIDDCSTDRSWHLLKTQTKRYKWLKIYQLSKNSGPIVARNKALEIAKGRYVAFLDVDDIWLPHKLETQIKFMIDKDCAMSFSDYRFISEDGTLIGRRLMGFSKIGWHLHHMTRYLGCLTVIVDRNKIPNFSMPNININYFAEDFLTWSRCILIAGPVLRCPHDLARYSLVTSSRSSNSSIVARSVWMLYRNIEKINLILAFAYYTSYVANVLWKKFWYKPYLMRYLIDSKFSWSILYEDKKNK
jgi:teichuronic acid biosynthesis glycosyltransferase TuaG